MDQFRGVGTTIVVLPLRSLLIDAYRRLEQLGVQVRSWSASISCVGTSCVLVSADKAGEKSFQLWLLQNKVFIRRLVFDEAHILITTRHYRFKTMNAALVRGISVPLVLLTGTLPLSEEADLLDSVKASNPVVFRAPSNRSNFQYIVETVATKATAIKKVWTYIFSFVLNEKKK
jgi:superfamily II DNA helicase RecQ